MSGYFDRQGNAITPQEWMDTFKPARGEDGEPEPTRHVARTTTNDRQGREHYISTVWLGLDHGLGPPDPPEIFESMVFCHGHECDWNDWQLRYSTEGQAAIGHAKIVAAIECDVTPVEWME
jgi:hypothetical protein